MTHLEILQPPQEEQPPQHEQQQQPDWLTAIQSLTAVCAQASGNTNALAMTLMQILQEQHNETKRSLENLAFRVRQLEYSIPTINYVAPEVPQGPTPLLPDDQYVSVESSSDSHSSTMVPTEVVSSPRTATHDLPTPVHPPLQLMPTQTQSEQPALGEPNLLQTLEERSLRSCCNRVVAATQQAQPQPTALLPFRSRA